MDTNPVADLFTDPVSGPEPGSQPDTASATRGTPNSATPPADTAVTIPEFESAVAKEAGRLTADEIIAKHTLNRTEQLLETVHEMVMDHKEIFTMIVEHGLTGPVVERAKKALARIAQERL
jgi:hypothetical protein